MNLNIYLLLLSMLAFPSLNYAFSSSGLKDKRDVENSLAFKTSSAITLDQVVDAIADKRVIYIGEIHNRYEHHLVQLYIIEALHKRGINLAIGMEMFERQQQHALDDYIAGTIDERTFLKQSRYFEVWNIDYTLYKDIIDFAKNNRIPIIGLNIDRKIISKVSKEGISSLSDEEKQKLPLQIDLSDQKYKKWLEKVFEQHNGSGKLDNFYQAQVLWDESMAESANNFINNNPNRTIVILAGGGHIAYESGIPSRLYRRNKMPYATVVNATGEELGKGVADFIIFPKEVPAPASPKLMISVSEIDGHVKIIDFLPESVSKKAGLKKNDIILSLDRKKIESLNDLKIGLLYKNINDSVDVEIQRKRFLLPDKTILFNIPFAPPPSPKGERVH